MWRITGYSSTMPFAPRIVARHARDLERQSTLFRFAIETCAGVDPPVVLQPTELQASSCALVISVTMSASFSCTSWNPAIGSSNCVRPSAYSQRRVVARHRRADRAPRDAVARLVQAHQRRLQAAASGQEVLFGDVAVVEDELGRDRGAQRVLALDLGRAEPGRPLLDEEPADLPSSSFAQTTATSAIVPLVIHIFAPLSTQPSDGLPGARDHAARVRAVVGLGQAEAADRLAARELRQPLWRCSSLPNVKIGYITRPPCTDTKLRRPLSPRSSSCMIRP